MWLNLLSAEGTVEDSIWWEDGVFHGSTNQIAEFLQPGQEIK